MRKENLLFSTVELLIVTALFGLGAVFLGLYFLPHLRSHILHVLLGEGNLFLFLGFVAFSLASLLAISFGVMQRPRHVRIEMGTSVDEVVVSQLVEKFWEEELAEKGDLRGVVIRRGQVEVMANVPLEEETLEEIEKGLSAFFNEQFGRKEPFLLSVTHQ